MHAVCYVRNTSERAVILHISFSCRVFHSYAHVHELVSFSKNWTESSAAAAAAAVNPSTPEQAI